MITGRNDAGASPGRKPEWLKRDVLASSVKAAEVSRLVAELGLHTVCQHAGCPNKGFCYDNGTATFLILGPDCTRACAFCRVGGGPVPGPPDATEPARVAEAVKRLGLKHAVITSVTRDDLPDGGAAHFRATLATIRRAAPVCKVELLIPDLAGRVQDLLTILEGEPDVLAHNLETVARLYPEVRPAAAYERSLKVMAVAADILDVRRPGRFIIKSGMMLGLGESREEVLQALADLRSAGCDGLTLGQYLAPRSGCAPVARYLDPAEFDELHDEALELGFRFVQSGPFVRSSYLAELADPLL